MSEDNKEESKDKKETIEVAKEDFQGLIAHVHNLTQQINDLKKDEGAVMPELSKNKKVRVHYYNGKPVVGFGRSYEERNPQGEHWLKLEIDVDEGKEKLKRYTVNYRDFREDVEGFTSELAEIVSSQDVSKPKDYGWTDKVEVDYENYRTRTVGRVPIKIVTPEYVYVVKRSNGEELTLSAKVVN